MTEELKPSKVMWLVGNGGYEYNAHAVCHTKADADRLAAKMRLYSAQLDNMYGSFHDVQVDSIMVVDADLEPQRLYRRNVNLWDNGEAELVKASSLFQWPFYQASHVTDETPRWRWVRAPIHNGNGGRLEVWGLDEPSVDALLAEKLADTSYRSKKEVTQ